MPIYESRDRAVTQDCGYGFGRDTGLLVKFADIDYIAFYTRPSTDGL